MAAERRRDGASQGWRERTSTGRPTASIPASYAGDSNFAAAASSATSVVIAAAVPNAALSPSTLTFATQLMGTTSSSQAITLTNSGTAALAISSIAASGDFAQTNNCGTLLAADESPQVVEGQWDREKVVLMSFPDEAAFHGWAQSPEYQDISKDRRAGADTVVLLVKGLQ